MVNYKKILAGAGLLAVAMTILPMLAFAANAGVKSNIWDPASSNFALKGPLLICVGAKSTNTAGAISQTCNNVCDLVAQVANIIYFLIALVLWIIIPILVTVGGLMIMFGGASSEMISRGKGTITGAVWGAVIILCSWVIVATFISVIGIKNIGGGQGAGGFGTISCSVPAGGIYDSNGNYIGE